MSAKNKKTDSRGDFDIASRFLQVSGIIGVVSVVLFAPESADVTAVRIVAGLLGGVALGARPEDLPKMVGAIFGRGGKDD